MTEQQITKDKIFERLIVAQNFLYFKEKVALLVLRKFLKRNNIILKKFVQN